MTKTSQPGFSQFYEAFASQFDCGCRHTIELWQLFDSDHRDLDQHARVGELGFDAGAAGQVLSAGPGVPRLVHGVAAADVRDPDARGHDLRFVGAGDLQETVDLGQDLLRLTLDVLRDVVGNDAGSEDEAVGLDDLGEDLGRLVADDAHGVPRLVTKSELRTAF